MKDILIHETDIFGQKRLLVVKTRNDEIIGSCLVELNGKTPLAYNLFVKQEYRRKGIGTEIMQSIISHCQKLHKKCLCINIDSHNAASVSLHSKLGFRIVYDYPNNNEDMWAFDLPTISEQVEE